MPKPFSQKNNFFQKKFNQVFFQRKTKKKGICSNSIFSYFSILKKSKVFWKVEFGHFKMSIFDFPKKVLKIENRVFYIRIYPCNS